MSEPKPIHNVIAGVRDLLPTLRERAQDTEDARRIPDESIKSLQETGFFKLLQPKPYGGYESDPVSFYTAVKLIASACGSTGWVASILGVHPWHLALFDAHAQEDVWSEDIDVRISGGIFLFNFTYWSNCASKARRIASTSFALPGSPATRGRR